MLPDSNVFKQCSLPSFSKGEKPILEHDDGEQEGYDVVLMENSRNGYLQCVLCRKLMRNPVQTGRGELACGNCYIKATRNTNICPIDGQEIIHSPFQDKAKTNEIRALNCYCKNEKSGCGWTGTIGTYEKHEIECEFQPIKCPFCNNNAFNLDEHVRTCENLRRSEVCPFRNSGCTFKASASNDMLNHLQNNAYTHMAMLFPLVNELKEENASLLQQLDRNGVTLARNTTENDNKIKELSDMIMLLTEQLKALQGDMAEMNKEIQRCVEESKSSPMDTDDVTMNGTTFEKEAIRNEISIMTNNLSDLDLRQQLLENTTYDGKLLWKIDNYERRLQQARVGEVTALHSAPSFTSRYGYKFCGRLYLNGDGMGKCTHLSIFFVVMKSECDNLLQWPFQKSVTFHLRRQITEKKGKKLDKEFKETFAADKTSSSFQKPVKEMNVAAGCPLFISHNDLNKGGFIKDDSLFIEITVK